MSGQSGRVGERDFPPYIRREDVVPGGFYKAADWQEYRKVSTTRMMRWSGAAIVQTSEGAYELPAGWEGYIAIDADGHPYPVEKSIHDTTYEPAKLDARGEDEGERPADAPAAEGGEVPSGSRFVHRPTGKVVVVAEPSEGEFMVVHWPPPWDLKWVRRSDLDPVEDHRP